MRLETNFRRKVYLQGYILSNGLSVVAVAVISVSIMLLINMSSHNAANEARDKLITDTRNRVNELQAQLGKPGSNELDMKPVSEFVNGLPAYRGRTPSAVLFELEKKLPDEVYLKSFKYDRRTGTATLTIISSSAELISVLMAVLEQGDNFSEILLVSQSETGEGGSNKFVIKLVETDWVTNQ